MAGSIAHVKSVTIADGANTDVVRPGDWNSSHAYTLQDAISISAGGGTSGVLANISSGTLILSAGNNITLSQNANTVEIRAGKTISGYNVMELIPGGNTLTAQLGQSSLAVFPIFVPMNLTVTRVDSFISMSISTSTNSSHAGGVTMMLGVYTRNGSTLSSLTRSTASFSWTNTSDNSTASLTSLRRASHAINLNFTPGEYWLAFGTISGTTNANWFTGSNLLVTSLGVRFAGALGAATNASDQPYPFFGQYSVQSASAPVNISQADVIGSTSAALQMPVLHFLGHT